MNKDGLWDVNFLPHLNNFSNDDIFNKIDPVDNGAAMFYQDDYFGLVPSYLPVDLGLGPELSRRSFVIYERNEFKAALNSGRPYSGYLMNLLPTYINPYTGTVIEK